MVAFTKRQREIVNTAIQLIAEKGIQELTIKNLSKKIGIAESAIYRHFDSKFDILIGILTLFKDNINTLNRQILEMDLSPRAKLEVMLERRFKYFSEKPTVAAVIFSEELFRNDSRLSKAVFEIMQENQNSMIGIISEGQARGEFRKEVSAEELSFMIIGAVRLIVTKWRMTDFSFDLVEEGQKLWQTIKILIT
ncbi:regulatory protein TetR [Caldithrix abyssi DSM 13497]|uniref:DNA-binding transcriptional regulator, AcrR family n=1 Tax=Caldithrix abyssi DSM 13497 TaxID=880073 RepID=H1XU55_CALAY|nr:TetR/AcrR family transcriptional regulator [Caldithrix abyssi]APF17444.1 DNA-binding transcriptional regulator, AcrR family [Caldithrix abyssi DSM 13497]EHO41545.1 regulatory protein TetR [Caldithrix abyssi DSM 13497]